MADDGIDYHQTPEPLIKAPEIDSDTLLKTILACYPAKSHWDIDVDLRAQIRDNAGLEALSDAQINSVGRNYVAIVAKIPLYSGRELDREREREYRRRIDTAGMVSDFISNIATRNHAIRKMALYRSLEARAHVRVQSGVVSASEQVTYLEKVARSQEDLVKSQSKIMENRLKMASTCEPKKHKEINAYLKRLAAVPQLKSP